MPLLFDDNVLFYVLLQRIDRLHRLQFDLQNLESARSEQNQQRWDHLRMKISHGTGNGCKIDAREVSS